MIIVPGDWPQAWRSSGIGYITTLTRDSPHNSRNISCLRATAVVLLHRTVRNAHIVLWTYCSVQLPVRLIASVLADTILRSPRKLFIFIIPNIYYHINSPSSWYPENYYTMVDLHHITIKDNIYWINILSSYHSASIPKIFSFKLKFQNKTIAFCPPNCCLWSWNYLVPRHMVV